MLPEFAAAPGRLKDAPPLRTPPANPQPVIVPSGAELSPIARESLRKAKRFTALVEVSTVKDGNPTGKTGTAFCVDRSGLFVTHAQVVESVTHEKGQVRLIFDNDGAPRRIYFAKLLRSDERSGLALLEINPDSDLKLEPLTMAEEADEAVGPDFDSFGYPDGYLDVAAARNGRAGDDVSRFKFNYRHPFYFQFPDVQLAHGRITKVFRDGNQIKLLVVDYDWGGGHSWGAPVLNRAGKLIGVVRPDVSSRVAVPVGEVAAFLKRSRPGADLAQADEEHFEVVRRKGRTATALVESDTTRGKVSGSAFCIDRSGLFVTNAHVVKDAKDIHLILEIGAPTQRVVDAQVLRKDDVVDLALLKGDDRSELEPLELARDADLYPTMRVVTFGFPFGTRLALQDGDRGTYPEVTIGVSRVTALRTGAFVYHDGGWIDSRSPQWVTALRTGTIANQLETVQFDGQLNHGNSGGPVLDSHGKVVGVARATIPGAAINFAIPVDRLSTFLKAPGLQVVAPAITWDNRAAPSTWMFTVVPPTPKEPLPEDLAVAVTVADGVEKPRRFWAEPAGSPGDFKLEFVPVPRDRGRKLRLTVRSGDRVQGIDVEEMPVKVKGREFMLGELHHVALAPTRWAYTVQGELIKGPIEGLGEVEPQEGGPSPGRLETKTIDLSKASELSVRFVGPDRPVRWLEVTVKAMRGGKTGKVVRGFVRNAEIPGAPQSVRTNQVMGTSRPQVVTRLTVNEARGLIEPEGRLEFGGELDVAGIPRGSSQSIRPPRVEMGSAAVSEGSAAAAGSRAINLPAAILGAAFSRDETLVALSCNESSGDPVPLRIDARPGSPRYQALEAQQRAKMRAASSATIRIVEVKTGREVQKLDQGEACASELAFSPDDSQLLAWSSRGAPGTGAGRGLVVWDLKTGEQSTTFPKPLFADVHFLKIAPDGRRVLTYELGGSAVTKTLRLCDLVTGKVLNAFSSIRDPLYSVSADWKRLVTFNYRPEDVPRPGQRAPLPHQLSGYRYRVVELETGRVLSEGQVDDSNPVIFSPDPSTCVLQTQEKNSRNNIVTVRDLATGTERRRFRIDPFSTISTSGVLGLTPDGKQLMAAFGFDSDSDSGKPGDVALFSMGTGKEVARIKTGMPLGVGGSAFSPSGRTAAIFGNSRCWLWAMNQESRRLPIAARQERPVSPLVRWTEGKIRDVAVGGGGRYLALVLADAQKVAVFDVNAADIVKTIPLASNDALLAAGAKKLVIAYPGDRRLERWDLESLKRDGELRPSPIDGRLHAIAMGSDSDGPLLACWTGPKTKPPNVQTVRFSFIDLDSLKVLKVGLASLSSSALTTQWGLSRSGGCFLASSARDASQSRLCASAGGTLFGIWVGIDSPFGECMILQADGNTVSGIAPNRGGRINYLIPGTDGKTVFTSHAGIITDLISPGNVLASSNMRPFDPMFPSPDAVYSLILRGAGSIWLRLALDNTRLLTITDLEEMVGIPGPDQSLATDRISVEKRFHLVPAAKLLVTIPTTNDRLVLRRLDIGESLARLPVEFLFVTSPPVLTAKAGQPLRHRIDVMSKQGGVTWALDRGPKGLTVSTDGEVSWLVPRDLKSAEETAVVGISDASGRKAIHKLTIHVE